jgi:iron complex outermembrane receptor protein
VKSYTRNMKRFGYSASAASMALGMVFASPAFAQAGPAAEEVAESDVIVVTGSLISSPNLKAISPINVTTAADIELKQTTRAEAMLREIPGIVPNIGSAVNNGANGNSQVDLRGLGSNRNIVLLNGKRIVPAGLTGVVNLDNIPLALVERVDVTTGGATTTYGADAITGVVNFVTKKDFAGVQAEGTGGITGKGDGRKLRFDVTIGANFDDGRGNAVLSVGYQKTKPVYQGDRSFSIDNVDSFSGAAGGSGTAIPSRFSLGSATRVINPATGTLDPGFVPFNFNPFNIFQTPFQRFNMFAQARYEISDAVEVRTRGLFSKNRVNSIIAPSGVFASSVTIPVSNPFLPVAARNQFCAANDFDANTAGIQTLTPAQCAAAATATARTDPNYRQFSTVLRRRFTETGPRISEFVSTVFDYSLGAGGAITDTINWDVGGAYGESENVQTLQGYVLTSRVRQALLATNTTACLDITNNCVPLNVFGAGGSITAPQAAFVQSPSTTTIKTSLLQAHATINGEAGFTIPWAADQVSFAASGEYRKYTAKQIPDSLSQIPGELGGAGGAAPFIDGGYDVYEAIAELNLPVVQDKPFFEDLTLNMGVRYSKYKVDAPGNPTSKATTYKLGGTWKPVETVTVRGTYARAVRAPNINELFLPNTVALTNLAVDPCAGAGPAANANLRAVCIAQGAPAAAIGTIAQPSAGQINATVGGNTNLKPEKADTYTAGVVITPFSGFSASLDYYYVKIKKAITTPTPADVIGACFGSISASSATSAACTGIRRDPTTGVLDGDPAVVFGVPQRLSNLGQLQTDGIDLILNYKRDVGFATLRFAFNGNYTLHSKFKATPTSINRDCVGYYSVNCSGATGSIQPKFQWSLRSTATRGPVDFSVLWRHIDGQKHEPLDVIDSGPAAAGFGSIKSYNYFDINIRVAVGEHLTLLASVENLFDKKPPIVGSTIGSTSYNSGNTYPSTYDSLGRAFSVSAKIEF